MVKLFPLELIRCLALGRKLPRDVLVLEWRRNFGPRDLVLLLLLLLAIDLLSNHAPSWSAGIPINNFHIPY